MTHRIWFKGRFGRQLKLFNLNKTDVVESVSHILFVLFGSFWCKGIHQCIERIFWFSIWDQFNQFLLSFDAGLFIIGCIVVTMKSQKSRSLWSKSIDGCESIEENQDHCQFHFDDLDDLVFVNPSEFVMSSKKTCRLLYLRSI